MPGITKRLGGSFVEIIVGKLGVQDFVVVLFPEGRLAATRFGGPAMEEEDFHGGFFDTFASESPEG